MTVPSSPFKGLAFFGDSEFDRRFFFGRERESELVAANLMASRLTVLYGPSGVGKSSLLRAGVSQRLRSVVGHGGEPSAGPTVVVVDSWRDDPVAAVAAAAGAPDDVPLADALAERALALGGELYVVFDQMEEYVLYHGRDGGPLADALEEVLTRRDLPVHVLLGVRDDSLAELDAFKRRLPGLFGNVLRLDHLTRASARAAIEGPLRAYAELGGVEVLAEDELIESVLDQVGAGRVEQGLTGRGLADEGRARRVEAPYMQLVLQRLWEVERERGSTTLRAATLSELGGATRIVEEHLERALATLDEHERDLTATLFNHLVTPSGTKIAHAADDLARYTGGDDDLERILGVLDAARIVRRVPARSGGAPRYEIFHDVLAQAVLAWKTHHEAQRAVAAERESARRRHRRLAILAAVALVAFAGMLALTAWALSQRSEALKRRAEALTQRAEARGHARSAQARELAASALTQLDSDPERSLRLAMQAAQLERTRDTESVLREALLESRLRLVARLSQAPEHLVASRRGVLVVAAGKIRLLDEGLRVLSVTQVPGRLLELRADAGLAVTGRTVSIFDPFSGRVQRRILIPRDRLAVRDVDSGEIVDSIPAPARIRLGTLGPGKTLLAVSDGARTVIVNALTGEGRHVLEQPIQATALRFGPAGLTLAIGARDGSARAFSVSTGTQRFRLPFGHVGDIVDIAFSPRATFVATASADGTARVWWAGGQPVTSLPGHATAINDVDFSADGEFVVTAGNDGTARVWRARNGQQTAVLRGHRNGVLAATFLSGSRRVVTAGVDRTVRLWDSVEQPALTLVRRFGTPVERVALRDGEFEVVTGGRLRVLSGRGTVLREDDAEPPAAERSADGSTVVAVGRTAVLTGADGRRLILSGHRDLVTSARFSPDGRRVVTASRDRDPIVWDAKTGRQLFKLVGHSRVVRDARYSPDGRWIVTAGPRTAGLWDASDGTLVYFLQGHEDHLLTAAFDPTSRVIVTGGRDGTVRFYRCDVCGETDELIALGRARLAATRPN